MGFSRANGGSGSGSGEAAPRHRLAGQVRGQSVQRNARRARACGSPCLVGALLHDLRYDSLLASVVGVLLHHFRYDSLQLNNYFQKKVLSIVSVCL